MRRRARPGGGAGWGRWAGLGLAALWVAAPLGLAAVAIDRARAAVEPAPVTVWSPVTAAEPTATAPGAVLLAWQERPTLVAPAWTGLVERVLAAPGDVVTTGSPLLQVDGITRVAAHTPIPFARPLRIGDRGEDVAALNGLLRYLGHRAGAADLYTTDTLRGVTGWARDLGASAAVDGFDPAWVVHLPVPEVRVRAVHTAVAAPVPAPGSDVVEVVPVLVDAQAIGGDLARNLAALAAADGTGADPDAPGGPSGPSGTGQPGDRRVASDVAPGTRVSVASRDVGATGPDGGIDRDGLALLAELVEPGQAQVPAALVVALPAGAAQVPTAAVVTGPGGATCVVARPSGPGGGAGVAVPVTVHDAYLGITLVVGVDPAMEVRVRPPAEARAGCRSS